MYTCVCEPLRGQGQFWPVNGQGSPWGRLPPRANRHSRPALFISAQPFLVIADEFIGRSELGPLGVDGQGWVGTRVGDAAEGGIAFLVEAAEWDVEASDKLGWGWLVCKYIITIPRDGSVGFGRERNKERLKKT